jgi:copper chaperone CopZ
MSEEHDCHVEPISKPITAEAKARADQVFLAVWGMRCPNCAMRVRNSLLQLEGVLEAEVSHINGIAQVLYDREKVDVLALAKAVASAGGDGRHSYRAVPI